MPVGRFGRADNCDDCSSGTNAPDNDGTDTDGEGACNIGDTDDDNDGVIDSADSALLNRFVCSEVDGDGVGQIIVEGTPEKIAAIETSHTGQCLEERLSDKPPLVDSLPGCGR